MGISGLKFIKQVPLKSVVSLDGLYRFKKYQRTSKYHISSEFDLFLLFDHVPVFI